MSKHTPGPWILGGCSGRMITTPSGYRGDGFIADVDTKANAQLIAAAPDMLEALKQVAEHEDAGCYDMKKVLSAIAKAEGRL